MVTYTQDRRPVALRQRVKVTTEEIDAQTNRSKYGARYCGAVRVVKEKMDGNRQLDRQSM